LPSGIPDTAAGLIALLGPVEARARQTPGVATVSAPVVAQDGHSVLLSVLLNTDPEAPAARAVVQDLRHHLPSPVRGGQVRVGGTTATIMDFDDLVSSSMSYMFAFILAFAFLLLLVVVRSVLLAAKAVLMNLLSIGAAWGAVVAVFQWGWLRFLGLTPAPMVDTITPPLMLAVVFGLSMDYEIFLLSRIQERWQASGDNARATGEALGSSARTITSAALTMIGVFLAFVASGLPSIQRLGLGCAVAIAVDATIVRLVLVPALMRLFGRWNWWLPRWLERLLGDVRVNEFDGHVPASAVARTEG
jgi:RND superfamily putative drug exporter